jgi:hypothetical protein
MLLCSKWSKTIMAQDIMANQNAAERPAGRRQKDGDFHSATPPSRPNGPSPFNDGPELIRDNHC